jgi:hypothetical protein
MVLLAYCSIDERQENEYRMTQVQGLGYLNNNMIKKMFGEF